MLSQKPLEDRLPGYGGRFFYIDAEWNPIGEEGVTNPDVPLNGDSFAYVIEAITGLYAPSLSGRAVHLLPMTGDFAALATLRRQVRGFGLFRITLAKEPKTPTAR